jgi:hypothetical protein
MFLSQISKDMNNKELKKISMIIKFYRQYVHEFRGKTWGILYLFQDI